jgi:hypothetical protein
MVCAGGALVACGADGQPCCAESTCTGAGSCCVGNACVAGTTGSCGALGACIGGSCSGGLGGFCGGLGQACCDGNPNGQGNAADLCTASGLACNPDIRRCGPCGGPGEPCCAGNACDGGGCCDNSGDVPTCVAAGAACSNGQGTCTGGGCRGGACGLAGQDCCGGDVACTAAFTRCDMGFCGACGGLGERCCDGSRGGYCGAPYGCDNNGDSCVACGQVGLPCCPGDTCAAGTCRMSDNTCR